MKNLKNLLLLGTLAVFTFSCGDDDDGTPEVINEEEVITTVRLTLTPDSGSVVTLLAVDSDGEGPNAPVLTVSGNLAANTSYTGDIVFLNQTESPAEDITTEVEEEADEHQVFYLASNGLNATTTYNDTDGDGNPLGLDVRVATGDASTGTFTVVLRHEPSKPNNGTLADAGGETDVQAVFDVTIE